MLPRRRFVRTLFALFAGVALGSSLAAAESELRLLVPASYGEIPSSTFDESGKRIGDAKVDVMKLPNGNTYLMASGSIDDADSMVLSAELEPIDEGKALRPVWQMSHSFDKDGRDLGIMFIDHKKSRAFCSHEQGNPDPPDELEIPNPDRLAHVPLNLLLVPLARGETEEIKFQFLACALGPRVVDAKATVARRLPGAEGEPTLVEVRYRLDLNPILEALARPFMPNFAFWFDPEAKDSWVAHRMPLASKGPAVLIVRNGISPAALRAGR